MLNAPILALIYNESVAQGTVPDDWRQANVALGFKNVYPIGTRKNTRTVEVNVVAENFKHSLSLFKVLRP